MLHEVRKLLFSEDVILRALLEECVAQNIHVPNSEVQAIKIEGYHGSAQTDGGPDGNGQAGSIGKGRVILEFVTANPDKPYVVKLNEHFVISALILACRQHNIPLPRSAAKHLQMTDQGLALTVAMRSDTPVSPKKPAQPTQAAAGATVPESAQR